MRKLVCPTCKTRFTVGGGPAEAPYRPFCSKRCQLIDLGHWFNESYRVSRPVTQLDGEALQLEDDTTQEARDPQDL